MRLRDRRFGWVGGTALVVGIIGLLCFDNSGTAQEGAAPVKTGAVEEAEAVGEAEAVDETKAVLRLSDSENICLIGNALGERMQHHNYWETLLHTRFPKKQLSVRNLCFPGDEPYERIRSQNFGDPHSHLTHSKATVVMMFFGYNESFAGHHGLEQFKGEMTKLVKETKQQNYSGKGAPQIALVSPIAFEDLDNPDLPDGKEHNKRLAMYTAALKQVAGETGVVFVDVFHPMLERFKRDPAKLTLNGAHLNDRGYSILAPQLMKGLFGEGAQYFDPNVQQAIADKNFHWWHRYRAVNGYSIYGARGQAGRDGSGNYNNEDVMERERVILDQMTANRDRRIWALARGEEVADKVDDSNTLPFLKPTTNVGGPNDPNAKRGKLGSLDYLTSAEQLKLFKLAPGYEINLVASEEDFPELANPVALNFDNKGRLWVATMASYPHWKPKTPMNDKLLIFEDHNKDGKADECKVFADGLHQPTGFEIGRGGVYVAQQPDILYLQDKDGDDKADIRIRQLVGFDSADSHHGIAAFEWGPDGALYFQEGTFKFSQVESPYGLTRLHEAGIWRYDPRTEKFGVHVSMAFANPWGHVFDRWGQNFIADASPGFSYWAAPISGHIPYPLKHPGGSQHRRIAAETGGDPQYRHTTFYPKRTRPSAGCELVSSRHFPPEAQGNFLLTNCIGDRMVLNHTVKESGSGFEGKEVTPIVSCEDGNFRPVDLQFGPDGALYIVDWHNALIGHLQHNLRDPSRDHKHGRIWRVTYKGRPLLTPPKIHGAPIPDLLELLKSPEDRTRYRARRELAERHSKAVYSALNTWRKSLDPSGENYEHLLLESLWLCQTHNVADVELLKRVLSSKDHRARAAGTRALSYWLEEVPHSLDLLRALVNDAHPRVRLEAVRACSYIAKPESLEVALDVLNHPMDHYLDYTLNETIRGVEATLLGSHSHDEHAHHGHGEDEMALGPQPLLFLDKSPQIIKFQLDRLATSRLLQVKRSATDAKFKPVYATILSRTGVSRQDREEAVNALVKLNNTNLGVEIFNALETLEWNDRANRTVIRQLSEILLRDPSKVSSSPEGFFLRLSSHHQATPRVVALAGLCTIEKQEVAWSIAKSDLAHKQEFLAAIHYIPSTKLRNSLRPIVLECLKPLQGSTVRRFAIEALAVIPAEPEDTFQRLAPLATHVQLGPATIRTLLGIPKEHRPAKESQEILQNLIGLAEVTPAAKRTTPKFLDAMHLADELIAVLPNDQARTYRTKLRELVVRVVKLKTVEEEMRYDQAYFAVEAGRPVQLVLQNEDLMPHNLVITAPGQIRTVAMEAAGMSSAIDNKGRQYVPNSKHVLFSTKMVPAHSQDVLTFKAPTKPGVYPYVCTFPNHWMRMYGAMVVVDDLDSFLANPTPPADPLGITRKIVQKWTVDDFKGDLTGDLQVHNKGNGERLFKEATCLNCHKVRGQGGAVGPELSGVFKKHKNDPQAILEELLDPSRKVDPKYALYNVLLDSGLTVSGIISSQDAKSVTIISNPEKPQPKTINRSDIDGMFKLQSSLMPKGILDRYTKAEILELIAYLQASQQSGE